MAGKYISTHGASVGSIADATPEAKYEKELHPMEQQFLDLVGFTFFPAEGVIWQPIYAEGGRVVAVRSMATRSALADRPVIRWVFRKGREITFRLYTEEVTDDGEGTRCENLPFPLWFETQKEFLEEAKKRWWNRWRR